jgi:predicted ATPase
MITEIGIENFKVFCKTKKFRLSNLNIFAGVNGRGKSTVFQSLLLLAQSIIKNGNIDELSINGSYINLSQFEDVLCSYGTDNIIRFSFLTNESECKELSIGYKRNGPWKGKICELNIDGKDYFSKNQSLLGDKSGIELVLQAYRRDDVNKIFSNFYYVSASRLGPTLYEENKEENISNPLGNLGENRLSVLDSHSKTIFDGVKKWYNKILGNSELEIKDSDSTLQLFMKNNDSMQKKAKSINMGFGYSYILSIIITILLAKKGSVIFIENPEAHLHPKAQANLMEMICEYAMKGIQFMIETHSEHIVNSARLFSLQNDKLINNDNISIHFFDEHFNVYEIKIEKNGLIKNWPAGFFDLEKQQLMEILQLSQKIK